MSRAAFAPLRRRRPGRPDGLTLARRALLLALGLSVAACDDDGLTDPGPDGDPTFDSVVESLEAVVDPSGIAPLSGEIRMGSSEPVRTSLTVLPMGGGPAVTYGPTGLADEHVLPVLGLYPGASNLVEVKVETGGGDVLADTVTFETEPLPDFLPDVEITVPPMGASEPVWTLSSLAVNASPEPGQRTFPIIFDETGTIRWYLDLSGMGGLFLPFERLENGNMVAGHAGAVFEFDMLGNVVNRWELDGHLQHHDVVEKPDGNLIVATDKVGLETVEDHIVELDRTSGAIVREWDLREVMDMDRTTYVEPRGGDWLHVNSVFWDERDRGLVISARNQGVFKVSEDNELLWILAPGKGWGPAGVNDEGPNTAEYLLTAVDADGAPLPADVQEGDARTEGFDWAWGQHAALILPNGNLLLLDNGDDRQFGAAPPPDYTRGVEYAIDEEALTVRQVWAYGRERGQEFFAPFVSDIDYLPSTGNRVVMPGITGEPGDRGAWVTEVTEDGTVVFEARLALKNSFGDGGGPDFVYRSERMSPYPD